MEGLAGIMVRRGDPLSGYREGRVCDEFACDGSE
jgi:hypothetical protein